MNTSAVHPEPLERQDDERHVRSPLTGEGDVSLLRTLQTSRLVHLWRMTYRIDISEEFNGLDEIHVYRCNRTGLVFFRPTTIAGSARLYRQLQAATEYYAALKWEHRRALSDLRGARAVLEIGCGAGAFVKRARQAGIDASGVDVNPDAVAQAQREGLPVRLRHSDDLDESSGPFDAVCSFQVLEHVPDPGRFLADNLRVLRPGGTLIVSVPNANGFLRYYDEILDLPPHHMSQWNKTTFEALQALFHVRLVACIAEPLSEEHVDVCVNAHAARLRSFGKLGAVLANRHATRLARKALRHGLRRLVTGHTLYARFVKID